MASVPAEIDSAAADSPASDDAKELAKGLANKQTNDLLEGFNNLNLIRQVGLMIGLAASIAIGFAAVLWLQGDDYRPLYASLDRLDSTEIIEVLEFNNIDFKVENRSGALLVRSDQIHDARLKLAALDSPGNRVVGFELLDQEQPLGTSQFMESARYKRSLEGELARTIQSINSVRNARVHLAIPKRSVFVRDHRKPSASVFVELFPGGGMQKEQVKSVRNMVASSIPEMNVEDVTVVDQRGNLLSKDLDDLDLVMAERQLKYSEKVEQSVIQRVGRILEPLLGPDNFKAEVTADLDFSEVEQTDEMFNPDLPAVRSEQTLDEYKRGDLAMGIPGALTNQPPVAGEAPEVADGDGGAAKGNQNSRRQATRNFELDRTLSYTKHQTGKLRRLSVAVVVNDKIEANGDGEPVLRPWTVEELERLSVLVRDAVGYDPARGDTVDVINSPFLKIDDGLDEIPIWQPFVEPAIKYLSIAIIVALVVFGLLRPVFKNLVHSGEKLQEEQEARELAALEGDEGFDSLSDETVTLTGGDSLLLPGPEESYEQQLNAIKGLIAEDPGRVAQVVKRWIAEDE